MIASKSDMEHFLSDQSKCHQCSARNVDIRDPAQSFSCVIIITCTHTSSQYAHARSPEDGGIDDVRSVGGSDDEHVLLGAHAFQ